MTTRVSLDMVTYDPLHDEFVLYLVEDGPWPASNEDWAIETERIRDRLLSAVEVALDGHLQVRFAESAGKKIRIQVDSPSGCPPQVSDLVARVEHFVHHNAEWLKDVEALPALRIVTGHSLGRFG